jgi:hypothetical protein
MNWGAVILSFLMPFAGTSLIAQQFGSQQSVPTRDPDQQPNGLVLLHFSTRARDLWVEARLLSQYRRELRVDSRHFPAFAEGS